MKKISKNKKDKILKWAQLGVPNSILSFWFKISVPKIKQIIREENTRSDQSNQNSYDSYLMIAQGKVHSPRQRQPPISLPVVPVNPAPEVPTPEVNTSDSYYYFLWFEEHRVNLQKEDEKRRLLEQHREELQRKDQLISDLTKQLHEKTATWQI
jgi:hypothetical protein